MNMWIITIMFIVLSEYKGESISTEPSTHQDLSIDCGSIYKTTVGFPAKTLDVVNISIPNSHNASIRIRSTCCEQIRPSDVACSPCSDGGERTCFVDQSEVIDLHTSADEACLNETTYFFTCHALLCNGSFPPGYHTDCNPVTNVTQICRSNGSWETAVCTPGVAMVTSSTIPYVSQSDNSTQSQEERMVTDPSLENGTLDANRSQLGTAIMTTRKISPMTRRSPTSQVIDVLLNSTAIPSMSDEEIKKDLMQFLIALGVVLVVVFILVCGFFIRKAKKKKREDDGPLDYWHEPEFIESICGKGSGSINPQEAETDETTRVGRYVKKSEQTHFRYGPELDNQRRQTANENVDVPRRVNNEYTDRYVTTATGSNFYSYRTSPDVDLGAPEVELSRPRMEGRSGSMEKKVSSFKPRYNKKSSRGSKKRHAPDHVTGNEREVAAGNDDIYAFSYKNKLKNSLDDWSAEESDV